MGIVQQEHLHWWSQNQCSVKYSSLKPTKPHCKILSGKEIFFPAAIGKTFFMLLVLRFNYFLKRWFLTDLPINFNLLSLPIEYMTGYLLFARPGFKILNPFLQKPSWIFLPWMFAPDMGYFFKALKSKCKFWLYSRRIIGFPVKILKKDCT